ncbi:MAG TPA: VWA domain-containing protein, partial [Thermoanaerobaculia bacterium]|nr:VWA domain-containing protein [Thermoanaerobaculia bacterium]
KGKTEIVVIPPFEPARVTISVDQRQIATRMTAPYTVEVDLGPNSIERTIRVIIHSPGDGRKLEWSRRMNAGQKPLSIRLRSLGTGIEATVTAPADDPPATVEFLQDGRVVETINAPPYRIDPSRIDPAKPLFAAVRSISGQEETAWLSLESGVHVEQIAVRTIPLYVSVTDGRGRPQTDLRAHDFRILDGGSEGRIVDFGRAFDEPISIALLIDSSVSMTPFLRDVSRAASEFVSSILRPEDHLTLFSIRSIPKREIGLTNNAEEAIAALSALEPAGKTAIYDGLRFAVRELDDRAMRRAIILFSDGRDTDSVMSYGEISKLVRMAGIPIYIIAFGQSSDLGEELHRFEYLAGESGGFVIEASAGNLNKAFERIEQDLRTQYSIRYEIADTAGSNEWRDVTVEMGRPRLEPRTVQGYFTP